LLRKPDLVATTLSGAAVSQVAEYILMMLLALGHHMPELVANQKRLEWPRDRWERFMPVSCGQRRRRRRVWQHWQADSAPAGKPWRHRAGYQA
jgi:phosphoglycerate dehydrogenase-like enzyme